MQLCTITDMKNCRTTIEKSKYTCKKFVEVKPKYQLKVYNA